MFKKILIADGDEAAMRILRARVGLPIPESFHDGGVSDTEEVISPAVEGEPEFWPHESFWARD